MNRTVPQVKTTDWKGFATFLGAGFDTLVESFDMVQTDEARDRFEQAKLAAQMRSKSGSEVVTMNFGGEALQVSSHGGRGAIFIASCPDFVIDLRSPSMDFNITVRYSAAGIWQYGVAQMRERVHKMLLNEFHPKDEGGREWVKISSAHICFDFYSPRFTGEMTPEIISRMVCHSSSKKHINFKIEGSAWGRAGYLETVTMGNKKSVEVQVYDKGKEITEISGKEWMVKAWEREGYYPPEDKKFKDIWRLELRFGKEFLKDRNINSFDDFTRSLDKIAAEALYTKRLTVQQGKRKKRLGDSNLRRRPLHPLWSCALASAGSAVRMLPIGRQITMSGEAYCEMLDKQAAGIVRARTVAAIGAADDTDMGNAVWNVWKVAMADPKRDEKEERAKERTKHLNVARA